MSVLRFDLADPVHGSVPCAAIAPAPGLPLCLFFYGGGGSRETLADIAPLLEGWWASGAVPRMTIATPDVGPFGFYLGWESFIAERFVPHVRRALETNDATVVVGISMGGYGALNVAFAYPGLSAVAAVSPMIEPVVDEVPLRNRLHYPAEIDQAAVRANQPGRRVLPRDVAIYIDAASEDALYAQDGAEHLHRLLWDHDIAHEYRLRREADHIGDDLPERLREAFAWVAAHTAPLPRPSDAVLQLRAQLAAARSADPGSARRYGRVDRFRIPSSE